MCFFVYVCVFAFVNLFVNVFAFVFLFLFARVVVLQLLAAAKVKPSAASAEIEKDLYRTFPNNILFEDGGPRIEPLVRQDGAGRHQKWRVLRTISLHLIAVHNSFNI
jgi:hypothetical protein